MENVIKTNQENDYTIEIGYDHFPESPREWDNLGTIAYKHNRYAIGDQEIKEASAIEFLGNLVSDHLTGDDQEALYYYDEDISVQLKNKIVKLVKQDYIILDYYLYDHSIQSVSTTPFSEQHGWQHASWDSGQVGWVYVSKERVRKDFGWKHITKNREDEIVKILKCEVEAYNQYLLGEVYYYEIRNRHNDTIDSCYGFYESIDYVEKQAKEALDYYIVQTSEQNINDLASRANITFDETIKRLEGFGLANTRSDNMDESTKELLTMLITLPD